MSDPVAVLLVKLIFGAYAVIGASFAWTWLLHVRTAKTVLVSITDCKQEASAAQARIDELWTAVHNDFDHRLSILEKRVGL